MIEELSDEYLPKEVLHRDRQIEQIKEIFQNFKRTKTGTNLILFGVTGSGKTTIIKKIIQEENNSIYVSCDDTLTSYKTLKSFFNINTKTHQKLLELTIKELKKNPKIIILDEVDKITRAEDFANLMSNLNTIYRKTMVPIILITLKRDLISTMKSDVRKTLLFEKVTLPSYNAHELKDILISRLTNIKLSTDEESKRAFVNYTSALAAQVGSARILMNLTLRCIQKNNFTIDFIDESYKHLIREEWMDFVNDINQTEKEFLKTLLCLCDDYTKEITAEELEKQMKLSGGRISQLINIFEKYAAITSRHENFGRAGGRKRFVKFTSQETYEELNKFINI